ncbi:MAG: asparagine synthase (glutamine-hydrolyzing) [Ardenticatenaceae bacterium]|nr:asparagine synthase (glutamine-hydrolyzing) [Ardenticatenaceae bacterium]
MCGIAGIILKPEQDLADIRARLAAMAGAMAHRGPDDEGVYLAPDGRVGLVNRRLAIRDLSAAGHMPMGNAAESVWITYNGEIYNAEALRAELEAAGYEFRSHSDTEVILHGYEAWGTAVVPRLRGMFALAIYDRRAGTEQAQLLLARDHLGIKPLYVAETATAVLFASEIKVLLASGLVSRAIDPAGLVGYLRLGSVPNPLTIYQGIQGLPPASTLPIAADRPTAGEAQSYWQLPTDEDPGIGAAEAQERMRALLAEAVGIRLVSDVPLGAFLSGGLDSSAVVALMRQATDGPIRTCSMVFAEAAYSEAAYARAMAEAVGAEHYERVITAADLQAELENILAAMDQPSVDGVNTYFVSQTARQAGLTVALSGLGGDELFGGYPNTFGQTPQVYRALKLAAGVPGGTAVARTALTLLPAGRRAQWARVHDALGEPPSPASAYLTRRGLFAPSEVQALVTPEVWAAAQPRFAAAAHVAARAGGNGAATMGWISRAELRTYTHDQLLRDTDVMSMAHSLEVRVPLLDVRLVEAALRLPAAVKRPPDKEARGPKPLLAAALGEALPALIRERQDKQGFTFPFAVWLRGPLAESLLQQAPERGWLNPAAVEKLAVDFAHGRVHWSRLWAVMALATVGQA